MKKYNRKGLLRARYKACDAIFRAIGFEWNTAAVAITGRCCKCKEMVTKLRLRFWVQERPLQKQKQRSRRR
eukprot:354403-Amphidinium_carterae.1